MGGEIRKQMLYGNTQLLDLEIRNFAQVFIW